MNKASWKAILYLCLAVSAACIPAGTAHASGSVSGSFTVSDTWTPATVSLHITGQSDTSVTVSWISPGDDGNIGVAAEYDIRYSGSVIDTDVKWQEATQAANPPSPKSADSSESFVVDGLSPGSTYYFAIRTADEIPNWSGLSESIRGNTLSSSGIIAESLKVDLPGTNIIEQGYSVEMGVYGVPGKELTLTELKKNSVLGSAIGTQLTGSNAEVPGNMELRVAGLTGRFENVAAAVPPPMKTESNRLALNTSAALVAASLILYLVTRRSHRVKATGYSSN